jgi:hypothetical protein
VKLGQDEERMVGWDLGVGVWIGLGWRRSESGRVGCVRSMGGFAWAGLVWPWK